MVLPKPELAAWSVCSSVNYYLDYGTSETEQAFYQRIQRVNYCLDYHTSETAMDLDELAGLVNYYLDCDTSETDKYRDDVNEQGELLLGLRHLRNCGVVEFEFDAVNYCLVCGTSETPILRTLKA